jgi:hypothetical protein
MSDKPAWCPACQAKRLHTPEDWKLHPYAGHGYTKEGGWSHGDLAKEKEKGK